MTRSLAKWGLVAVLGGGLWLATAGPASAQWMGGIRPGFYWQNPATGQQFGYNFNYNTNVNFAWVNPYTGGRYAYNYQTTWSGFPPPFLYSPGHSYPSYTMPGMAGGVGIYGSSNSYANPFVREQLRVFRNAPVPNQGAPGDVQPGNNQAGVDVRNKPGALNLTGLNKGLVEPSDEAILSGKVLNQLAATIRELEGKGAKAESPLLPAELVSHINYEGGPSANVIALLRTGKPPFPAALAEHEAIKADLNAALTPVLDGIAAGKRPDPGAADRLAATVKKAREFAATLRLAEPEAKELDKYFTTLDSVAKVGKDAGMAGLFPQRWASVGATVSEVIRHMEKYKLAFAAAAAGDEDVYYSLHRGLVGYYAALSPKK